VSKCGRDAPALACRVPRMVGSKERQVKDLSKIKLGEGMHHPKSEEMCLMEAVAWWRGEPHTSHPKCVDDVLAFASKPINDLDWPANERTMALIPLVIPLAGSKTTRAISIKRAYYLTDWVLRGWLPLLLPNDKQSRPLSKALQNLPEVTPETVKAAFAAVEQLKDNRHVEQARIALKCLIKGTQEAKPIMPMVWLGIERCFQHAMVLHDELLRDTGRRTRRETATRVRSEMVTALRDAATCF